MESVWVVYMHRPGDVPEILESYTTEKLAVECVWKWAESNGYDTLQDYYDAFDETDDDFGNEWMFYAECPVYTEVHD